MPHASADHFHSGTSGDPAATVAADATVDSAGLGELMHAAFRGLRGRWMQQLAPFDLTPHQFRALNGVGRGLDASGSDVRLKDLAERLRIAPRSATEVIDQLQEKGLVERTPDPNDRRATRISLSEAGQELRARIRSARRREADEYFSVLSAEDRAQLGRILGQLEADGRREPPA